MKCPYVIEPHQIQGLDFINIFPVIQWLVKRSVENRTEKAEKLKAFAVGQFHNHFSLKSDRDAKQKYINAVACVKDVQDFYSPRRKYKRKDAGQEDEKTRVRVTLLEYGNKGTAHSATTSRSKTSSNAVSKDDADGTDGGGDVINASNEVVQAFKIDSSIFVIFLHSIWFRVTEWVYCVCSICAIDSYDEFKLFKIRKLHDFSRDQFAFVLLYKCMIHFTHIWYSNIFFCFRFWFVERIFCRLMLTSFSKIFTLLTR